MTFGLHSERYRKGRLAGYRPTWARSGGNTHA